MLRRYVTPLPHVHTPPHTITPFTTSDSPLTHTPHPCYHIVVVILQNGLSTSSTTTTNGPADTHSLTRDGVSHDHASNGPPPSSSAIGGQSRSKKMSAPGNMQPHNMVSNECPCLCKTNARACIIPSSMSTFTNARA